MSTTVEGHELDLGLDPGDVVTDVVVLARVQRADETDSAVAHARSSDVVVELGLIEARRQMLAGGWYSDDDH